MTSRDPDVTFVIAAFNAGQFLDRAIESALAQVGVSVEVVVVDDCSSDDTLAVAQRFAGQGVRCFALAENRGPGGARNAGFAAARGRWIAVLDSDDTVTPDRMARMIALAEAAGAQVVVDNLAVASSAGIPGEPMFPVERLAKLGSMDLPGFIASNRLFASKFNYGYMKPAFERRFVENRALRYDETLRIGEDYVFFASALAQDGVCAVDSKVGYVYHVREDSVSRILDRQHVAAMQRADAIFERDHVLDAQTRAALRLRSRSLKEAASFLTLVEQIKDRAWLGALETALADPRALRHLRMPIVERTARLAARLEGFAQRRTPMIKSSRSEKSF